MLRNLPRCVQIAKTILLILASALPLECFGQTPPEPPGTAAHSSIRKEQPPFDRLELFGFLAAGPPNSYASHVIEARGTNFTPDAAFIALFPFPGFPEMLKNIKPRAATTTSPGRDAAYELLRQAWGAKQNRQLAASSGTYQEALLLAPNSATLHLAYADSLLFSQDFATAETQARQSLKLWPENVEAHGILALSLTAQKQFAEAESESREVLRIFPEDHYAMFALGVSLTHEGKYTEAIPLLQKLIAAVPKMIESRKLLGISFFETGEIDEGISQLHLYVKDVPADAEGHYYLGEALRSKGGSEEAHAQFAEAARLQPSNPQYKTAAQ